ncbi:MAG: hypothetical protein JNL18_05045 [Planctomycetaceae bacterium]|nr:hypothetical protein [Planctomycetaceae bacterium]
MFRTIAISLKTPLIAAALLSFALASAEAVQVTGVGYTNHSHDQFGDPIPGSPFFKGTVNSNNNTQYVTGPSAGLSGSIKTPNSTVDAPIGASTAVSGRVTINGNATEAGVDATVGTADDWLDGNNLPAGVTLSYDVSFTITAANGNNLITANGNTGNGLAIANDAAQNYGNLDAGEVLQISAVTTSSHAWGGAPTAAFVFTPGSFGVTRFTALRSNTFDEATEGITISDGTNTWGFGTSTGTAGSNLMLENNLGNPFGPAGGDLPLTITTDAGAWTLKGFRLSTPVIYDLVPAPLTTDADFNGDGLVDGADFLVWQQNLGLAAGATNEQGDADGNAAVNDLDLVAWQTNFGAGATPPPISAIPEPAAATLAALALLAGAALGKRS